MKKVLLLSLLLPTIINSIAQKQQAFFEIGSQKIFFEFEEKMGVWRTVSDTIVSCKGLGMKKFPLGTSTSYVEITPSDFKTLYREIFNDKGCIWTRLTNDIIRDDQAIHWTSIAFQNDSNYIFINPGPCYRHDTVMQINPVTLEEEMTFMVDSEVSVKYNLGAISKRDLNQAISNQFGLTKNELNVRLKSVYLKIFDGRCGDYVIVNYDKSNSLDSVKHKIENLPVGSALVITEIDFANTNGRKFNNIYEQLAVMKIKE